MFWKLPRDIGVISKLTYINDDCGYRCAHPWRAVTGFPQDCRKSHIINQTIIEAFKNTTAAFSMVSLNLFLVFQQSKRRITFQVFNDA